jgi:hypothetical protein
VDRPLLLSVLLVAGLLVLGLRRPLILVVLLLPMLGMLLAGLAGLYPLSERLVLFAVPVVAVVVAAPLDLPELARRLSPRVPLPQPEARCAPPTALGGAVAAVVAVSLGVLTVPAVQVSQHWWEVPYRREEAGKAHAYVAARRTDRDLVLVDGRAGFVGAAFYGPRTGVGPYQILQAGQSGVDCGAVWLGEQLRADRRWDRVWLVLSHTRPRDAALYRQHLAHYGPPQQLFAPVGARVFRFDRSAAPSPTRLRPPGRCLSLVDPADRP